MGTRSLFLLYPGLNLGSLKYHTHTQFVPLQSDHNPYTAIRVGDAKTPGPPTCSAEATQPETRTKSKQFVLEIANVTHLVNNGHLLCTRRFNAMCITEHSLRPDQFQDAKDIFGKNHKMQLSKLDREKTHQVGGTGVIVADNSHIIKPNATCPHFSQIVGEGRADICCFEVSKNNFVVVYIIYGATNGDKSDEAAALTDALISCAISDAKLQPAGPKMIVGDFNATVDRLPSLKEASLQGDFLDVGSIASSFKGVDNDTTCRATHLATPTRRDFVFANDEAKDLIDKFEVDHDAQIPVHDILTVTFKDKAPTQKYNAVRLPRAINDIFI